VELDDRALPLTRGLQDIWLAQETGHSGAEWQLGLFVRIEGTVERDALESAIRRVIREAEPIRAACFEVDGQVFQRAIDKPDVELDFYDLSGSRHPVQEAQEIASSIQRTLMPLAGPLFRFGLFRTRPDEFYLLACCHHIVIDASGVALVGHRIASVYSAIVSGKPISPAFFGSVPELVGCGLEDEASNDCLEIQAHWTGNFHSENGPNYRLPQAVDDRDWCWPSAPVQLDPSMVGRIKELSKVTQRRQLANVFRDNERAPDNLINGTLDLIETGALSMSIQCPIISHSQLPGRLRRVCSHGHLTLHRPIGIGVITTSNTRHFDRAANGRRRLGSTRQSQQANRIQTRLRNHQMRRG
jgi:hypothetical protein